MDSQSIAETYHALDPVSGMIQTTGNYPTPFDPERKTQFLSLYKLNDLGLRKACRSMGMSEATVTHHLKIDPEFKRLFDECEREYIEDLECVSRQNALNPKSVIERIFQLKCLLPLKYGQENKPATNQPIQINISGDLLIDAKRRVEMLDAKISKGIEVESAKMLAEPLPVPDNNTVSDCNMQNC